MTAVLCRVFGLKHIEIAEDIASETFLKAIEVWSLKGVPVNPTAWLYTVAKNKTKDCIKRNAFFEKEVRAAISPKEIQDDEPFIDFTEKNISDSQLEMIFVVCNPINSDEAQICLALQILCGFSLEEIADAFLSKKETIKKRVFRARDNLRNEKFKLPVLQPAEINSRLDSVLTVLYLLFNEGYFSRSNNKIIRKDLCLEAMRLTFTLVRNKLTDTPKVSALLALMCFQSSRLDARMNDLEDAILFDEQDKQLWDKELIEKGNYYLAKACSEKETSKYHIEASIAWWHTAPNENNKWENILQLYNHLLLLEYSPMTALNRTFAFAKVHGNRQAIKEAKKVGLQSNHYYHSLLGFLYSGHDRNKAADHYTQSINLSNSATEKRLLSKQIDRLNEKTATDHYDPK